jgi:hypothetical protein
LDGKPRFIGCPWDFRPWSNIVTFFWKPILT